MRESIAARNKSRTRRAVEGLGGSYLSFVVNGAIRLVVTPFYLARLGPELMGFQSFIRETINYFQVMDLGIGTGLTAIVAKDFQPGSDISDREAVRLKLRAGAQLQLLLAVFAVVLSVVLASSLRFLAQGLPKEYLGMARVCTIAFGLTFAVYLGSRAYKSFLVGMQLIGQNALFSMISASLGAGIGVALVAQGWSLYGLAAASLFGAGFYLVQVRWRSQRLGMRLGVLERPLELAAMRDLAGLSAWVLLASAGALMSLHSARLILGIVPSQGMSVVNMYALLVTAPSLIRIQANRISVTVRPGLTQLAHSESGEDRAKQVGRLLVRVSALLGASAFLGIWLVNGAFVERWVGPEYYAGDLANLLVAILYGLSVSLFSFKVLMEVKFDYRRRGMGFFAAGILTAALSFVLVPFYGIEGVLVAAIVGEVVTGLAWFIPLGMRWLTRPGHSLRTLGSLISAPLVIVLAGALAAAMLGPVPSSWPGIIGASTGILVTTGSLGALWLRSDVREYLNRRRA